MSKIFYVIAGPAGSYRAQEGSRFPWTEDEQEAMRFADAKSALAQIRSHANGMAAPYTDYDLIEVLYETDGTMPMAGVPHDGYRPLTVLDDDSGNAYFE